MADSNSFLPTGCESPSVLVPSPKFNGDHPSNVPSGASGSVQTPLTKEGNIPLNKSPEEPKEEFVKTSQLWSFLREPYHYQPPVNPFPILDDEARKWLYACPLEWLPDDDFVEVWPHLGTAADED